MDLYVLSILWSRVQISDDQNTFSNPNACCLGPKFIATRPATSCAQTYEHFTIVIYLSHTLKSQSRQISSQQNARVVFKRVAIVPCYIFATFEANVLNRKVRKPLKPILGRFMGSCFFPERLIQVFRSFFTLELACGDDDDDATFETIFQTFLIPSLLRASFQAQGLSSLPTFLLIEWKQIKCLSCRDDVQGTISINSFKFYEDYGQKNKSWNGIFFFSLSFFLIRSDPNPRIYWKLGLMLN